jgi:hypothetical protein
MVNYYDTTHPDYPKAFMYTHKKTSPTPEKQQVEMQTLSVLVYGVLTLQSEIPFEECAARACKCNMNCKDLALQ